MKKIISIDGGGIRGIIPGQVLVAIEKRIQLRTGDQDARISDYIDFVAGTSTGGILAALLLHPARYSATSIVDLYVKYGATIFNRSLWHRIKTINGITGPKYSATGIEKCLHDYFGSLRLSELLKPCIITSYDIHRRESKFFAKQDFDKMGEKADFYVKDACRATSAAPTYFAPKLIKSISGTPYACVDGGVFANNPTLCAYSEVRNAIDRPTEKNMFIISIGTGSQYKKYKYNSAKNWGEAEWVEPVIDIIMAGAEEITNYQMTKIFFGSGNSKSYIRIQPNDLGQASPEMDNVSKQNINALKMVGNKTANTCDSIGRIVSILLSDKDSVKF